MQLQKTEKNQLAARSAAYQHSQRLIQCLVNLESPATKQDAKMELVSLAGDLMPAGKPLFLDVIKYPKISDLVNEHGKKTMLKAVFLLVKDFCNSVNVVRNMNEDQMIEAAAMLIDECDNFRLEDYTMMFSLGKRGDLVKIFDRLDITVITQMLDAYWLKRKEAAEKKQEDESRQLEGMGSTMRMLDNINPEDQKMLNAADGLAGAIGDLKTRFKEWKEEK